MKPKLRAQLGADATAHQWPSERARADREDEADDAHRDAVVVAHAHAQRRDHEAGAGRQVGDRVERRARARS